MTGRYEGVMTMHPYKPRICLLHNEPKASQRRPTNVSARASRAAQPKGIAKPTKLYAPDTSVPTGQRSMALHEATLIRLSTARGLYIGSLDTQNGNHGSYLPHDTVSMGADIEQAPICMLLPRRVANAKESNDWKAEHHCSATETTGGGQGNERKACFPCSAFQFIKDRHGPQAAIEWTAALAKETHTQLTRWQAPTREKTGAGISLATLGVVIDMQRPHPLAMMWDAREGTQPQAVMNAYTEYAWNPRQALYPLMRRHGVTFNERAVKDPKNPDLPNATAFINAMVALRSKAALSTLHLASPVTIGKACDVDVILPLISPDTPQDLLPDYLKEATHAATEAAGEEKGHTSGKGGSGGKGGKGAKGGKGTKGGKGDDGDAQPKSTSGRRGYQVLEQEGENEEEDGENGGEDGEIGEDREEGEDEELEPEEEEHTEHGMDTELVATEQQMIEAAIAREAEEKTAAAAAETAAAAVTAAVTAAAETAAAAAEAPQAEASAMPAEATAHEETVTATAAAAIAAATESGEEEDADPEQLPDTEELSGKRAAETPLRGPPSKKSSRLPSRLPSQRPSRAVSRDASQERGADDEENERAANEMDSELQETIAGEVDLRQIPAGALSTHEQHSQEASSSMQAQQGGEHAANQRMPHVRRATRRGK